MTAHRDEDPTSAHFAEFEARYVHARQVSDASDDELWRAVFDVAGQISDVRHLALNMQQGSRQIEYRLLGYPDDERDPRSARRGGELPAMEGRMTERAEHQADRLREMLEEQRRQIHLVLNGLRIAGTIVGGAIIIWLGAVLTGHVHFS